MDLSLADDCKILVKQSYYVVGQVGIKKGFSENFTLRLISRICGPFRTNDQAASLG